MIKNKILNIMRKNNVFIQFFNTRTGEILYSDARRVESLSGHQLRNLLRSEADKLYFRLQSYPHDGNAYRLSISVSTPQCPVLLPFSVEDVF